MKREEDLQDRPFTRDDEYAALTARAIARNAADRKRIMSVLEKVAKGECPYAINVKGSDTCHVDMDYRDMCGPCLASYLIGGGS